MSPAIKGLKAFACDGSKLRALEGCCTLKTAVRRKFQQVSSFEGKEMSCGIGRVMCLNIFEPVAGVHFVNDCGSSLWKDLFLLCPCPLFLFPVDVAMLLICSGQSLIIEVEVQPWWSLLSWPRQCLKTCMMCVECFATSSNFGFNDIFILLPLDRVTKLFATTANIVLFLCVSNCVAAILPLQFHSFIAIFSLLPCWHWYKMSSFCFMVSIKLS